MTLVNTMGAQHFVSKSQPIPTDNILWSQTIFLYCFLADRTIGRAFGTLFRLSVCRRLSSVCDVLHCGETVRPS